MGLRPFLRSSLALLLASLTWGKHLACKNNCEHNRKDSILAELYIVNTHDLKSSSHILYFFSSICAIVAQQCNDIYAIPIWHPTLNMQQASLPPLVIYNPLYICASSSDNLGLAHTVMLTTDKEQQYHIQYILICPVLCNFKDKLIITYI